jgi:hypothetical protein
MKAKEEEEEKKKSTYKFFKFHQKVKDFDNSLKGISFDQIHQTYR